MSGRAARCEQRLTGRRARTAQPTDAAPRRLPDPWSLRGLLFNVSTRLWDRGLTPGTVVRTLGPMGPGLISKYARNRCGHRQMHCSG